MKGEALLSQDVEYLIKRLKRVVELLNAGEVHMAIAKLLADISALKTPASEPILLWPRTIGVVRMVDDEKQIMLVMDRKPTDNEFRQLHNFLAGREPLTENRDIDELLADLREPGVSIADIRRARAALKT
jgi:hypothetical protein